MNILPIQRYTVCGNSMLPTLKSGQEILCFNWAYLFYKPQKGDIVAFKFNGREMIKRIQKYDDRHIFVTGDNKRESTDSRKFGMIDRSAIIGKVIFFR